MLVECADGSAGCSETEARRDLTERSDGSQDRENIKYTLFRISAQSKHRQYYRQPYIPGLEPGQRLSRMRVRGAEWKGENGSEVLTRARPGDPSLRQGARPLKHHPLASEGGPFGRSRYPEDKGGGNVTSQNV
jgi:hypothetical protein